MALSTGKTSGRNEVFAQIFVLAALFAAPAWLCLHDACVWDADVWWHIRTGQWILEQHAVPRVDTFSTSTLGHPWQEYSWLFDLLITRLYARLGLPGILGYSATMIVATTIALFHLVRQRVVDLTLAVLLTGVASFCMSNLYSPRSWHFTILFFVIELGILLHVRRTRRTRRLLWLPLLFALWANLHIQFIDGLLVLALAAAESIVLRLFALKDKTPLEASQLPVGVALAAFAGCVLATLLNPYGWHIYQVAHDLAAQQGVMNGIMELKSLAFRTAPDFVMLFVALAAAAALARQKKLPLFETALFVLAAFLSFRSQRDIWILATVAAAVLSRAVPVPRQEQPPLGLFATPVAAVLSALVLLGGVRVMHINQQTLTEQLQKGLPVRAAAFIKQHHYPGPVFNTFAWGGFLMEDLRLPVSVDGRAALHGDTQLARSDKTWNAAPDWNTDSLLTSAGIVVGPIDHPLVQLLRTDARYTLVYADDQAAVFVPRR